MNKICFVEMPFDQKFNGIWKTVIKPTVEELGDQCLRVDDMFNTGSILNDIFTSIQKADYIIADLSEQNPNVYYELGYSHALNKKVILLSQDISKLPFDLKQRRVIVYQDTASGAFNLKNDLIKYVNNL
jgi:nucleoside 2-deoxyribosyltransferase